MGPTDFGARNSRNIAHEKARKGAIMLPGFAEPAMAGAVQLVVCFFTVFTAFLSFVLCSRG